MSDTIFFRLLDGVNRPSRLSGAIEELREGGETSDVHQANPSSFHQVPGSPFSYWVGKEMRSKFVQLPPFESEGRTVKQGLATADDFRFVRAWWEIMAQDATYERETTLEGRRWVPFAKGGEYSPYYADIPMVVNWQYDGEELRKFERSYIRNEGFYFRPGLTFPRRTKRFCPKVLPTGGIFGHGGQTAFSPKDADALLGLLGSSTCQFLVTLFLGTSPQDQGGTNPQFETGMIQKIPVAHFASAEKNQLQSLTIRSVEIKRGLDRGDEVSHVFHLPALLLIKALTLTKQLEGWQQRVADVKDEVTQNQTDIDEVVYRLYEVSEEDRQAIKSSLSGQDDAESIIPEGEDVEEVTAILDGGTLVADLLSYTVGCVFGRWDTRLALDPSLAPQLQDPFAPLPVCSPGMLVGPDGLPAQRDGIASEEWMRARPDAITPPPEGSVESPTIPDTEYPLDVDWDGILVDDPDHPDDIVRRVRDVLELLWGGRADEIEHEACELLGVKNLRAYFRNPRKFWDFHVKRYSKSRRKAPIYWLLQSPKRNFGLWIYYHRLDPDILFKALTKYVEPKIRLEQTRLEEYEALRHDAGTGGREAKQAEKAVEDQEALLADLREFRDRLQRAAGLYLRPDLNDGVVLNIAPLHELVPWKEAKSKWDDLLAGKYEWSSIGKQLREKGLV